jgi:hypothetical protein
MALEVEQVEVCKLSQIILQAMVLLTLAVEMELNLAAVEVQVAV